MGSMFSCARWTKVVSPKVIWVVYLNGHVDEFPAPVSAKQLLQNQPLHFICNSRDLYGVLYGVSCPPFQLEEELQLGELYFLLPLSALQSAENLLALAARLYSAARKEASSAAQRRRSADSTCYLPCKGGGSMSERCDDSKVNMTSRRPRLRTIQETGFAG